MKSLSLNEPHMIVMVGLPGSGKSHFASRFSSTFNAPCVSYEDIQIAITGGNPSYSRDEIKLTGELAAMQLDSLLITGKTIIVDGGSATATERRDLARKAKTAGYKTLFIWVQTDEATAKQRVSKASSKQRLTVEQYELLSKRFTPPTEGEKVTVISGKHTYATQAKTVLKRLTEGRAEQASISNSTQVLDRSPKTPGRRLTIL